MNAFTGALPEFGTPGAVTTLSFSGNSFNGTIPTSYTTMTSIVALCVLHASAVCVHDC